MKAATLISAALVFASSCTMANAAATVATWSSVTSTSATGSLNGVTIKATACADSPFGGVSTTHLSGTNWQASMPLPVGSESLIALSVNGGDYQQFDFTGALATVLVYIENMDNGSVAFVTATGATSMSMLSGSSSMNYVMANATSGFLGTSNQTANGEGDAILEITGPLSSLKFDYAAGMGNNAVFYGFVVEGSVMMLGPYRNQLPWPYGVP